MGECAGKQNLWKLKNVIYTELQIIFTVVSVFTKENFNSFSNLISPFGIGTHEIQWLFSIFLTHNWFPIYDRLWDFWALWRYMGEIKLFT